MGARTLRYAVASCLLTAHRGFRRLVPTAAGTVRILLFHDIPAAERPAFAQLVGGLARDGRLIGPAEAEARLSGRTSGRPAWLISFDDGFASNAQVAREILDPLGAKALFFVCPGLMDLPDAERRAAIGTNIFDGKRPAGGLDLMRWDDLDRLLSAGHAVGNHTMDHRRLTTLSPDELAAQVGRGAERIASRLGRTDWFAYTFGDIASIHAPALAEIARHHRFCRSGIRGANGPGTHPLALRADQVDLSAPPAWRNLQVEGGLDLHYREARARLDGLAAVFPLLSNDKLGKP